MKMTLTVTLDVTHGSKVDPGTLPTVVSEAVKQTIDHSSWLNLPGSKNSPERLIDVSVLAIGVQPNLPDGENR